MEKKSKIVNVQFGLISTGNNLPLLVEQIRETTRHNEKIKKQNGTTDKNTIQ